MKGFPEELMSEPIMKGNSQYKKGLEKSMDEDRKTFQEQRVRKLGWGARVCSNKGKGSQMGRVVTGEVEVIIIKSKYIIITYKTI